MNNYIDCVYGRVSGDIPGGSLTQIEALLRSYVRNTQDYPLLCSGELFKDVAPAFRLLIGKDFQGWLKSNYDLGLGPRAGTVRVILHYLSGEVGGRTLVGRVKSDIIRTEGVARNAEENQLPVRTTLSEPFTDKETLLLNNVTDKQYYELLEALGGQFMARFMLTFLGVSDA